jgi:hypothetical protein
VELVLIGREGYFHVFPLTGAFPPPLSLVLSFSHVQALAHPIWCARVRRVRRRVVGKTGTGDRLAHRRADVTHVRQPVNGPGERAPNGLGVATGRYSTHDYLDINAY